MRHYDRLAEIYDSQYDQEQEAKIKAALSEVHLKTDSIALDLGCGTGLLFKHIANSVGLLVGIDISAHILKEAKKRAKKFQNVAPIRAEADNTPFQNQTFDTVFAITLLQNAPNPKITLKEIKRIAKQNATITLTALKKEFTLKTFKQLLKNSQVSIKDIKINNKLKDYIATCQKLTSTENPSLYRLNLTHAHVTLKNTHRTQIHEQKCRPMDHWQKQEKSDHRLQKLQPQKKRRKLPD